MLFKICSQTHTLLLLSHLLSHTTVNAVIVSRVPHHFFPKPHRSGPRKSSAFAWRPCQKFSAKCLRHEGLNCLFWNPHFPRPLLIFYWNYDRFREMSHPVTFSVNVWADLKQIVLTCASWYSRTLEFRLGFSYCKVNTGCFSILQFGHAFSNSSYNISGPLLCTFASFISLLDSLLDLSHRSSMYSFHLFTICFLLTYFHVIYGIRWPFIL